MVVYVEEGKSENLDKKPRKKDDNTWCKHAKFTTYLVVILTSLFAGFVLYYLLIASGRNPNLADSETYLKSYGNPVQFNISSLQSWDLGRPASFATSYMVGQEDKRANNRTMIPTLKNQCSCRLSGSGENRAFERCWSTHLTTNLSLLKLLFQFFYSSF